MAQLNNYPNIGNMQNGNPQAQFPYGNSNLLMNTPYDNYMGVRPMQQNLPNQYLKCRPVAQ